MRLAVYGYVDEQAGSLSSANFLLLHELLARGQRIDFYAIEGWVTPGRLAEHPNLRYIPVRRDLCRWVYRHLEWLPGAGPRAAAVGGFGQLAKHLDWQPIGERIAREHRRSPYTAMVALGLLCPWKVPGLPTVSWAQGCPSGEAGWYARHPRAVFSRMGPAYPPLLVAGYALKYLESAVQHPLSDLLIDSSSWTVGRWRRFGVPRHKLVSLPYPFDPAAFAPARPPTDKPADEVRFLHLGRIVPRKRVDLLLAALTLARRADSGIVVQIVGGSPYRRTAAWVRAAAKAAGAEYTPAVPRTEVPALLARADVVAQPSQHENFGAAVAEGLLSGRPVLLGPTNGTCDHVEPTPAVVRFAEHTPESVAAGMLEAAGRVRADRAGLAAAARAAAERAFAVRPVTDRFEQVLATVARW